MSPAGMQELTLETVAKGAAAERFQDALEKVIANILDANTDARLKRTITMKFVFTPDEGRSMAGISLDVDEKLAPPKAIPDVMHFGVNRQTGEIVATRYDPQQLELGEEPDDREVIPIAKRQQGGE